MTGDEPAGDREAALVEFQATMQRFLEAQESIMLAYLTGERTVPNARPVLQPMRPTAPIPSARGRCRACRSTVNTAIPMAGDSGGRKSGQAAAASAASTALVAMPSSIRRCRRRRAAAPHMNGTQVNGSGFRSSGRCNINGIVTTRPAPFGRAALSDHLISLVEDRTGYPRDMLGMDQNLEADLGNRFHQAGRDRRRAAEVAAGGGSGEDSRPRRGAHRAEDAQRHPRSVVVED